MLSLLFPLALLGVMYFFLIVPQRKRQRAHDELLRHIGAGDEVLTTGGIYGGVTEVDGETLFLEIAPDVEIKVSRKAIAERVFASGNPANPSLDAAPDDDAESPTP
ncbi:MAG: preprotein translocase subunit YajC [Acidimicrobiia bacterium]|nr:preprotein translocase subunit YajC [Acidimicrobiia bacterium]